MSSTNIPNSSTSLLQESSFVLAANDNKSVENEQHQDLAFKLISYFLILSKRRVHDFTETDENIRTEIYSHLSDFSVPLKRKSKMFCFNRERLEAEREAERDYTLCHANAYYNNFETESISSSDYTIESLEEFDESKLDEERCTKSLNSPHEKLLDYYWSPAEIKERIVISNLAFNCFIFNLFIAFDMWQLKDTCSIDEIFKAIAKSKHLGSLDLFEEMRNVSWILDPRGVSEDDFYGLPSPRRRYKMIPRDISTISLFHIFNITSRLSPIVFSNGFIPRIIEKHKEKASKDIKSKHFYCNFWTESSPREQAKKYRFKYNNFCFFLKILCGLLKERVHEVSLAVKKADIEVVFDMYKLLSERPNLSGEYLSLHYVFHTKCSAEKMLLETFRQVAFVREQIGNCCVCSRLDLVANLFIFK